MCPKHFFTQKSRSFRIAVCVQYIWQLSEHIGITPNPLRPRHYFPVQKGQRRSGRTEAFKLVLQLDQSLKKSPPKRSVISRSPVEARGEHLNSGSGTRRVPALPPKRTPEAKLTSRVLEVRNSTGKLSEKISSAVGLFMAAPRRDDVECKGEHCCEASALASLLRLLSFHIWASRSDSTAGKPTLIFLTISLRLQRLVYLPNPNQINKQTKKQPVTDFIFCKGPLKWAHKMSNFQAWLFETFFNGLLRMEWTIKCHFLNQNWLWELNFQLDLGFSRFNFDGGEEASSFAALLWPQALTKMNNFWCRSSA